MLFKASGDMSCIWMAIREMPYLQAFPISWGLHKFQPEEKYAC